MNLKNVKRFIPLTNYSSIGDYNGNYHPDA
jgi:hypothetical protein